VQLFTETQPIDLLTVSAHKEKRKIRFRGDFYLIITKKYPHQRILFHSRIILTNSTTKFDSPLEESYDETTDVLIY
jgi:replicative DNA helicase